MVYLHIWHLGAIRKWIHNWSYTIDNYSFLIYCLVFIHSRHPETGWITLVRCSYMHADSFMSPAKPWRLIWLAMPCASSTRSKSGCHWTVFSRMKIGLGSLGWAQVASSESGICRRLMLSCRPPMSWAISEYTLSQNWVYLVSELTLEHRVSFHAGPHFHKSIWALYGSHSYSRLTAVCNEFGRWLGCEHREIQRISAAICDELHWLPCQFSRGSTRPSVCFWRRPRRSLFPTFLDLQHQKLDVKQSRDNLLLNSKRNLTFLF